MSIEKLIGKTLVAINGAHAGSDEITFEADSGERFRMWHSQDCCEGVDLNEVIGDVADLIGSPITEASEESNSDGERPEGADESWTWTFYKIGTVKGRVTLRWLGTSNGYYSEDVSFDSLAA